MKIGHQRHHHNHHHPHNNPEEMKRTSLHKKVMRGIGIIIFLVIIIREGVKKIGKKAVRLTALVDPPLPPSGQENVKKSRQVLIFGVILPFYKG